MRPPVVVDYTFRPKNKRLSFRKSAPIPLERVSKFKANQLNYKSFTMRKRPGLQWLNPKFTISKIEYPGTFADLF